jgi:CRP/FNR family cyclic AMP-dependent transcriptional regulator
MTISSDNSPGVWVVLATRVLRQAAFLRPPGVSAGEALVSELIEMGNCRVLAAEQTYQRHGDPVTHVSIVLSGYLLVGLVDALGKSHIVRPLGAGQPFNILPVLDGGLAIHDARAGPETKLLLLPKSPFLQLMKGNPEFSDAIHALLFARNRQLYQELADMALLSLRQRCARLLLHVMENRNPPDSSGPDWCVSVSQSEFAEMLGYTRPIVNKELRRLADEGLIHITYRRIVISNPNLLERVALLAR